MNKAITDRLCVHLSWAHSSRPSTLPLDTILQTLLMQFRKSIPIFILVWRKLASSHKKLIFNDDVQQAEPDNNFCVLTNGNKILEHRIYFRILISIKKSI